MNNINHSANLEFTLHLKLLKLMNACSSNLTTSVLSLVIANGPFLTSDIFIPLQYISFITVL